MAQNKSLSTQEVAQILHVSKSTIYELIRRGEINSYKIGRKVRFTQDDVDVYIARSRHEQSSLLHPAQEDQNTIILSGQDVVLDILANFLHQRAVPAQRVYLNSFEGLLALYEERVDAAACHLYDAEEKSFNVPFVKKLMPGVPAALINISYRTQGFYVAAGNPKEIRGWRDLARRDISVLNRCPGSSARVLLDGQLHRMGLDKRMVAGYEREMKSHLTMAAAIAAGEADLAIGTERISRQIEGLDFIPLLQERFDLAVHRELLETDEGEKLLEILRSEAFRKEILPFSGNDYHNLGKIVAEV